jgi:hypothetical protein
MPKPIEYLEISDAGRKLGLTAAGLRVHVNSGRLVPAAVTARGLHLFTPKQIEKFRQERQQAGRRGFRARPLQRSAIRDSVVAEDTAHGAD